MQRFAVLLALALCLALSAPPSADAQQPKRGGVVRIAECEAPGLDPHLSKGFRHHDGYGLGMRLLFTWLDK
jgi:hypothetical protein